MQKVYRKFRKVRKVFHSRTVRLVNIEIRTRRPDFESHYSWLCTDHVRSKTYECKYFQILLYTKTKVSKRLKLKNTVGAFKYIILSSYRTLKEEDYSKNDISFWKSVPSLFVVFQFFIVILALWRAKELTCSFNTNIPCPICAIHLVFIRPCCDISFTMVKDWKYGLLAGRRWRFVLMPSLCRLEHEHVIIGESSSFTFLIQQQSTSYGWSSGHSALCTMTGAHYASFLFSCFQLRSSV